MLNWKHDQENKVDQVMGACFMVRKKVFDEIGLLDEGFFIWFEEVDFCKRVKDAGYDVCFIPDAEVIHEKAASFNQVLSLKKQIMMNNSMLRYFRKHHNYLSYLTVKMLYPISLLLALNVQILSKFKKIEKSKQL